MDLIATLRAQLRAKLDERAAKQAELDAILETPSTEGRDLNDDETAKFAETKAAIVTLDEERDGLEQRVAELEDLAARRAAADKTLADLPDDPEHKSTSVKVTSETRTYNKGTDPRGAQFLADVARAQVFGDYEAVQRLSRHMHEETVELRQAGLEYRDIGTGAFTGLTVPQYLTDMVAPKARAMRPFADICRHHDLPASGMTVNISRITTGSAVAVQATENSGVQETNIDDTLLTVNVRTIAGMQDVSRQAVERGAGIDVVVLEDLVRAYHTELDRGILNDDGTGGTHLGLLNVVGNIDVAYTDASPTVAELYPKLADGAQQVESAVFGGITHLVMAPRRWWWLAASVGSTFPFLNVPGSATYQAGQVGSADYMARDRSILGFPVIVDGNILTNRGGGTNQDVIFGVTADECHLWEEPNAPIRIRAEEVLVDQLSVRFVVYGYSAFTAGRYPDANFNIEGTGLITPTF